MPSKGIAPLAKAIRKARMNEMQLTSIHGSLLQLCLIAKNLKPALEFLNVDVTEISTEVYRCRFIILKCLVWETYYKYFLCFFSFFFLQNGYFDAKHFLLYYYYGGVIYAALKNYERSLYFFEVALTTPSSAISHIMLESYKKYILVSLILQGKVMRLNCITCLWLLDDNLSHLLRLRLYQSTRHKWWIDYWSQWVQSTTR